MKRPGSSFNEKKATQVAARFLALAPARRLPYISLIKFMYLADRAALIQWASPITDDKYYSLDYGPVLSNVKNLIDLGPSQVWSSFISPPSNYMVELIDDPGTNELSKAELELIDETFSTYGNLSKWDLVEKTHELPEWKDPDGGAIPISIEDILTATGLEPKAAHEAAAEIQSFRQVHALFSR